jgi:hypothetical protein
MNTKKLLTVGVVAVLGVLAYSYYKKEKGSGYSNASGFVGKRNAKCRVCYGGSSNYYAVYGQCRMGDTCKE